PSTPVRDLSADEWVGASKWWHKLRTAVTSDPGGATGATTFQRKARFEPYDREQGLPVHSISRAQNPSF
ncbi:hypothetical protein ACLI2R_16690, partial [Enterococcus faecalis]